MDSYAQPLPARLQHDPSWRAAFRIFECSLFAYRGEVWNNVDLRREEIHWEPIFDVGWSSGEYEMLLAAASLFNGDKKLNLYSLVCTLSDCYLEIVVDAIREFLPNPEQRKRGQIFLDGMRHLVEKRLAEQGGAS